MRKIIFNINEWVHQIHNPNDNPQIKQTNTVRYTHVRLPFYTETIYALCVNIHEIVGVTTGQKRLMTSSRVAGFFCRKVAKKHVKCNPMIQRDRAAN